MDVFWVSPDGIGRHDPGELGPLLAREGGFVWIDIAQCDEQAGAILREQLNVHPLAVQDCMSRSHVPKLRTYPDQLFLILHAPLLGAAGHVHLLELDAFIGYRHLITVHGPFGEGVAVEEGLQETRYVQDRIANRGFRPKTPAELAHALGSAVVGRLEAFVSGLASKVAGLERRIMTEDTGDPEEALEELFRVRHELLTVRTMASAGREVYARMGSLAQFLPAEGRPFVEDLVDRYERARSLCDGEKEFLDGVADFYQSRTTTKINIAMERLALIAAVVLPVSAISGVLGMNVISNSQTDFVWVAGLLAIMGTTMFFMLRWARRHGWW
ncbi:MAG: magnesium transporter CorA family protein [Actinomycetota bacterium]